MGKLVTCVVCKGTGVIEPLKKIEVPVDPVNVERFKKWCAYYGMTVKKKLGHTWEISNYEDIDLYWLGCNMMTGESKKGIVKK